MNPLNPDGDDNCWLSCITIQDGCSVTPDQIMDALAAENIETRPIWKPMHLQPVFEEYDFVTEGGFKSNLLADSKVESVSEDIFNHGLCLPSDIKNTPEDMEKIIGIIRKCFGKN